MGESIIQVHACQPCDWHTRWPHKAAQHRIDHPDHALVLAFLRESEVVD